MVIVTRFNTSVKEMKSNIVFLLPLCIILNASTTVLDDAKIMADRIYSKIDETVETKVERLTREDYTSMYGKDRNGRPIYTAAKFPNDLVFFNGGSGETLLWPESYFGEIEEFVNSCESVDFKYSLASVEYIKQPELRKNEDEPDFASVFVTKEWIVSGKTYNINDNVIINLKYNNIANIHNDFISLEDCSEETLDGMLAKAAGLYSKADYNAAATLYQKIVKLYPNNDDAWYYLGVMYFKMEGVGKLTQKQRLQKAYDCWKNSNQKKARRAISYITDGRE